LPSPFEREFAGGRLTEEGEKTLIREGAEGSRRPGPRRKSNKAGRRRRRRRRKRGARRAFSRGKE
jgi:hypothetical protein